VGPSTSLLSAQHHSSSTRSPPISSLFLLFFLFPVTAMAHLPLQGDVAALQGQAAKHSPRGCSGVQGQDAKYSPRGHVCATRSVCFLASCIWLATHQGAATAMPNLDVKMGNITGSSPGGCWWSRRCVALPETPEFGRSGDGQSWDFGRRGRLGAAWRR
jgi:hypothetical protein